MNSVETQWAKNPSRGEGEGGNWRYWENPRWAKKSTIGSCGGRGGGGF